MVAAEVQQARKEALQQAKEAVAKEVSKFEAAPVFGFSKGLFLAGVVKTYLTIYILGRWPEQFWKWHSLQVLILAPIQGYRWYHMKGLAYFIELCWVVAFVVATYLASLAIAPHLYSHQTKGVAFRLIFAFGSGPLGTAVTFLGNSLVPHSIDYTMSLMIHLVPLFTSFALRWHVPDPSLFPIEHVSFYEYYTPALAFLLSWACLHMSWMALIGLNLDPQYKTTYSYTLQARNGNNMFAQTLGKIGDGSSEYARLFKYELISVSMSAISLALSYKIYESNVYFHFAIVVATSVVSASNGANWYEWRLKSFTKSIDDIMFQDAAEERVSRFYKKTE